MQNEFRKIYARFIYEKITKELSNMKNVQKKKSQNLIKDIGITMIY
jgi:hypothetical protein